MFNEHTSYYAKYLYLRINFKYYFIMKLNSKVYQHRFAYWKNQLKLFWLRDLGCISAFRIIKRVTTSSPVEVEYYENIDLDSRSLLGYSLFDIELIRTKQIDCLESHFRTFLGKLNYYQLRHFIMGNLTYSDIILKYCNHLKPLEITNLKVFIKSHII